VPHAREEFPTAADLKRWLREVLPTQRAGKYYVARAKSWGTIPPGSICAFHKQKRIVGDGVLARDFRYGESSEISPVTGQSLRYEGWVMFDPKTIRTFDNPIQFSEAEDVVIGRGLTWRSIQPLTRDEYAQILARRSLRLPTAEGP
jgi:hypothetical protein